MKAPASCPNSSVSSRVSLKAAQFTLKWAGPAARQIMQPLGDQFLAGAALADHQSRAVSDARLETRSKASEMPDRIPIGAAEGRLCLILIEYGE